jgi:exodeoxyribonuclease V gamma subunit
MPLVCHASNQLDALGDRLIAALAGDLRVSDSAALFRSELVLVPTAGLRDWLRQRIAQGLGICAGVELCFPGRLHGHLSQLLSLPDTAWDPQQALWVCLACLDEIPELTAYLGSAGALSRRGYQLAVSIIDCFERYALYRPEETLIPWEQGRAGPHDADAPWQPELWRLLRARGAGDPLGAHQALLAALQLASSRLPARIHAFGFNSLAPRQLEVFAALGAQCEVDVYSLQPSWGYWGDDQGRLRDLVRKGVPSSEWGNRLLGDWGAVGRDFLRALDQAGADYLADFDDFTEPGEACLLHRIQSDLCAARLSTELPAHALVADDPSLQVHACHGLRRQLEVAKAAIHQAFVDQPDLQPQQVALMCPDPALVAPMAAAVFAGTSYGPPIAVAVADRRERVVNPVADVLLRLLALLPGRFEIHTVIDFISCDAVAQAWGLGSDELARLREWVDAADLRWGVDAQHRQDELGYAYAAGSWRHGLQRLMLAWWHGADADSARLFADPAADPADAVVPVHDFQGEDYDALQRISALLLPLLDVASAARATQPPHWWRETLLRVVSHVVRCRDGEADFADVASAVSSWAAQLESLPALDAVPAEVVAAHFGTVFEQGRGGDFGRGAVTICGMQPMRSVPFRVLCLVGLDDGAFPRVQRSMDFDLLRRHPRAGDRDLRGEDRYLLLELLVSVRDRLIITYQGYDARDKSELPPAVPVGELLETAAQSCGCSAEDLRASVVRTHRLHGSLEQLAAWPSAELRAESEALLGPRQQARFEALELPALETPLSVSDEELIRCWRRPAAAYLRRLGVQLLHLDDLPRGHERFSAATGLDRYRLAERLISADTDDNALRGRLLAEAWLPPGALAEPAWQTLEAHVAAVRTWYQRVMPALENREARVSHGGLDLGLSIAALHPTRGVVLVHPGSRRPAQELALYIRVVLAAAAGVTTCGVLASINKGAVEEWAIAIPNDPTPHLDALVRGYLAAQCEPLPFAPDTSRFFVAKMRQKRSPWSRERARAGAVKTWSQRAFRSTVPCEAEDAAHRVVYPEPSNPLDHPDFEYWAETIWDGVIAAERGGAE